MFEAVSKTAKISRPDAVSHANTPGNETKKTDNAEMPQKQQENRQEKLQGIHRPTNMSQEFLNELEKDIKLIHNIRLKFSLHGATGRIMVKVINRDTGKTIREVPSEKILDIAAKLDEITGILSDSTV